MKILITGAIDPVGEHLLKELLQRGEEVRILLSPTENAAGLLTQGVEVVRGDILDARTLGPIIQGIEVVWHLAELKNVHRPMIDYYLFNVTGTENLYRAAQAAGARRFVYKSSYAIYGLGRECVLNEADVLRPDGTAFSLSKAAGDHLLRRLMLNSRMETVIVRPTVPFGPGDDPFFKSLLRRIQADKVAILGRGDNALPLCSIADIVQGLLLAGYHDAAVGNVYNIGNDHPLTQQEILQACAAAIGTDAPLRHVPYLPRYYWCLFMKKILPFVPLKSVLPAWLDIQLWGTENRYSIEKARRELGYIPQDDLYVTIQRAVAWFNGVDARCSAPKSEDTQPLLAPVHV